MFRKFAPVLACSALRVGGCGGGEDSSGGSSSDADAAKPLTTVKAIAPDDSLIAKQARLGDALGPDDCSGTFRN